jgi:hypothetical protein
MSLELLTSLQLTKLSFAFAVAQLVTTQSQRNFLSENEQKFANFGVDCTHNATRCQPGGGATVCCGGHKLFTPLRSCLRLVLRLFFICY